MPPNTGVPTLRRASMRAGSLEELAAKLKIDPAGLSSTVERFNAFARKGVDEDFQHSSVDAHHHLTNFLGATVGKAEIREMRPRIAGQGLPAERLERAVGRLPGTDLSR